MATEKSIGVWSLTKEIDLVYSPDDEAATGCGFYLQRYPAGETSTVCYESGFDAMTALKCNLVEWQEVE